MMSTLKGHISFKQNFTPLHIFIILFLLISIATSAVLAFDPAERKNKTRDERFLSDAKNVSAAIKAYKEKEGHFPWNPTLVKNDKDAIGFYSLSLGGVGVCGETCMEENAGPLITKKYLGEFYLEKEFALKQNESDDLKIGKAFGATEQALLCFVPLSKFAKEKGAFEGNAWELGPDGTKTLGETSEGAVCDPNSSWSSCYVCAQ